MGKKNRQSKKASLTESDDVVNNPFGALSGIDLPKAESVSSVEEPRAAKTKRDVLRIRIEKKGRGGKTVTVIDGFSDDTSSIAAKLKQTLGTGGSAFEGNVELQGDCRTKAAELLRGLGFTVKGV